MFIEFETHVLVNRMKIVSSDISLVYDIYEY